MNGKLIGPNEKGNEDECERGRKKRDKCTKRENVRGATPRNFNLDPGGRWLLAGGQDSHTLAAFAVDQHTGELTYNRSVVHAPSCICVLFQHE